VSQQNVKTSSDAIAALNRDGVEGFLAYCDSDVEWITPPNWLEDRVLNGHDGVRRAIALFDEQLDDFRVENGEWLTSMTTESSCCSISVGASRAATTRWSSHSA
jgi:ketosteroid isomerase-like protein